MNDGFFDEELEMAMDLWRQNKLAGAICLLTRLKEKINAPEKLAEVLVYRGWILKEQNNFEAAFADFKTAQESTADIFVLAYSYDGMGSIFYLRGMFEEAKRNLEIALGMYRNLIADKEGFDEYFWACALGLFDSYLLIGDIRNAMKLKREMAARKDMPMWFKGDSSMRLGNYYYGRQDYKQCIPCYEEATAYEGLPGDRGRLFFYLGSAYYNIGQQERGREIIRNSLPLLDDNELRLIAEKYL
jgi:tetratricopeptide (TPR) repeat protein